MRHMWAMTRTLAGIEDWDYIFAEDFEQLDGPTHRQYCSAAVLKPSPASEGVARLKVLTRIVHYKEGRLIYMGSPISRIGGVIRSGDLVAFYADHKVMETLSRLSRSRVIGMRAV